MRPIFKPKQSIVFEGDSLCRRGPETWPYLRIVGWNNSWADQMAEMFFVLRPDLQLSMINIGVGGSCIYDIEKRYEAKVQPRKPAWVFLSLGTNDANRQIPLADLKQRLTNYAQRLKKDSGGKIMYIRMPDIADEMEAEQRKAFNTRRRKYFKAIASVVEAHDGIIADIDKPFRAKAKLLRKQAPDFHQLYGDGCHFSELGNRLLCGEILRSIGYPMLG